MAFKNYFDNTNGIIFAKFSSFQFERERILFVGDIVKSYLFEIELIDLNLIHLIVQVSLIEKLLNQF